MKITDAISRAIQGGWKSNLYDAEQWEHVKSLYPTSGIQDWTLDPAFWQALGKTEGWGTNVECNKCGTPINGWKAHMHRLIDHLAEGGTIESHFVGL